MTRAHKPLKVFQTCFGKADDVLRYTLATEDEAMYLSSLSEVNPYFRHSEITEMGLRCKVENFFDGKEPYLGITPHADYAENIIR
ncbi:hypothetical protein [Stenotrophomonas phage RAS14]